MASLKQYDESTITESSTRLLLQRSTTNLKNLNKEVGQYIMEATALICLQVSRFRVLRK
jgi:hypothetical protein